MNCGCGGIVIDNGSGDEHKWECIRCGKQARGGETLAGPEGDAAGEHLSMDHGEYDAWGHVGFAFLVQLGVGSLLLAFAAGWLGSAISPTFREWGFCVGGLAGAALTIGVFWDRWRCTEAFASTFCSGAADISALYVPFVALHYANSRGIPRLFHAMTGRLRRKARTIARRDPTSR